MCVCVSACLSVNTHTHTALTTAKCCADACANACMVVVTPDERSASTSPVVTLKTLTFTRIAAHACTPQCKRTTGQKNAIATVCEVCVCVCEVCVKCVCVFEVHTHTHTSHTLPLSLSRSSLMPRTHVWHRLKQHQRQNEIFHGGVGMNFQRSGCLHGSKRHQQHRQSEQTGTVMHA